MRSKLFAYCGGPLGSRARSGRSANNWLLCRQCQRSAVHAPLSVGSATFVTDGRGRRIHCKACLRSYHKADKFWYHSQNMLPPLLDKGEADSFKAMGFNRVRVGYGKVQTDTFHRKVVLPLPKTDWPTSEGRPAWPSTPSVNEWLEMARRGLLTEPQRMRPHGQTVKVTQSQFNTKIELATLIISRNVIGVRSDVEVPRKFLGHFRYRWGFNILTSTGLPAGLVRYLARLWLTEPSSLWLGWSVPLRIYLKEVPFSLLERAVDRHQRISYTAPLMADTASTDAASLSEFDDASSEDRLFELEIAKRLRDLGISP